MRPFQPVLSIKTSSL